MAGEQELYPSALDTPLAGAVGNDLEALFFARAVDHVSGTCSGCGRLGSADSVGWQASSDTKAALLRTLQASTTLQDWKQLPVGASLSTSLDNLDHRAKRLATQLAMQPSIERVAIEKKSCRIGAGVWSSVRLESTVLQLFPKSISASALAEQFALAPVPVWANVQSDHVEFVLRTIEPDEDRWIVKVD